MKTTNKLFVLSLVSLLFSCEKPKDPDAGKPYLKSIYFKNLPAKDFQFDPRLRTITIQLPSIVPAEGFIPVFELSENTEIIGGITPSGALDLSAFCGCKGYDKPQPEGRLVLANDEYIQSYRTKRFYRVISIPPPGCPEPIGDQAISYSFDNNSGQDYRISLPMKNLYSNPKVYSVILKNLVTEAKYGFRTVPGLDCLNGCSSTDVNKMTVLFSTKWSGPKLPPGPGSFEVSIDMSCGDTPQTITFPQPLVIKE